MKQIENRVRPLIGGFLFMALFGLFGTPSAPIAEMLPGIGGDALASCQQSGYMWDAPSDIDCDGIPDGSDECPADPANSCADACYTDGFNSAFIGGIAVTLTVAGIALSATGVGAPVGFGLGLVGGILGAAAYAASFFNDC